MRAVVGCWRLFLLLLLTVVIFIAAVGLLPVIGPQRRAWLIRKLAPLVPKALGLRVTVRGRVPDPSALTGMRRGRPGYLVSANHISFLDIFLLDAILPVRFIAKKEIGAWPVFGTITTHVGTIYIDRSRKRAVLEVAEAMAGAMREGANVLFFPEGTTGPGDALLPFHANLFAAACAEGVSDGSAEILPVTIRYTQDGRTSTIPSYAHQPLWEVLKRVVFSKGLGAEVTVLAPIPAGEGDRRRLSLAASAAMAAALGWTDATAEAERSRLERLRAAGIREA